jgi:hypothetical protein
MKNFLRRIFSLKPKPPLLIHILASERAEKIIVEFEDTVIVLPYSPNEQTIMLKRVPELIQLVLNTAGVENYMTNVKKMPGECETTITVRT